MTKIVIVAGGLATRMRPITEEIPKCLIDINGKPLIQHQLEFFKKHDMKDIIFCVAHLADKVKDYFKDGKKFGLNIQYVQETKELMGTAGSVKLAEPLIGSDEDFIVYYGDNLTNMDFEKFLATHRKNKGVATICMRPLPRNYKSTSIITLDLENRVKTFIERPTEEQRQNHQQEARYNNSGIYAFNKNVFSKIPSDRKFDFAKELFPSLIESNSGIYGYVTNEFFREIGKIEKYEQFLKEIAGKTDIFEKNRAVFLDRDGTINVNVGDVIKPEQLELISGAGEAIRKIREAGYKTYVVTNQPCVAKGFCTFEEMDTINKKLENLLEAKGATIDKVYLCPHHPEKGFAGEVKELKIDCDCRKPKPGLLLKAIAENNVDASQSWMIGDSPTDIACGKNAGVKTVLLTSGGGSGRKEEKDYQNIKPDYTKKDLREAQSLFI